MVKKLFEELCALDEVEALALGGSRAGEHFDEASDYDVYLYCDKPIPEKTRRDILSKYCSVMEIGNHFWEYEDNCCLNNGIDIDLLYRDLDAFTSDVAEVVERFQPHNAYTTCMWYNLLTCKMLYDRDGRLAQAKERFSIPYPRQLRENILNRSWKLLHGSMPAYDAQLIKAVKRGDLVSVNHRTAGFLETYFDFLFALNGEAHPGEKRLIQRFWTEPEPDLPEKSRPPQRGRLGQRDHGNSKREAQTGQPLVTASNFAKKQDAPPPASEGG